MRFPTAILVTATVAVILVFSHRVLSADGITRAPVPPEQTAPLKIATFAGGCFWCMEKPYDKLDGVKKTVAGYTGGHKKNPTYEDVSAGTTGHREVIQVTYDPEVVSYEKLLEVFWHNVDPLNPRGQFCDNGTQYTTAIYVHDDEQRKAADKSLEELKKSRRFSKPVVTPVINAATFYPAEEYHQDYYEKNPIRYKYYRFSCGRDQRLEELWGE